MCCVGVVQTVAGGGLAHQGAKTDCTDTAPSALDGVGREARFNYPWGIVFDPTDDALYVADCVSIHGICYGVAASLPPSTGILSLQYMYQYKLSCFAMRMKELVRYSKY